MMTVEKRHEKEGDTPDLFMLSRVEFGMLVEALRNDLETHPCDPDSGWDDNQRYDLLRKLERCLDMEDTKA